jgi:NitT/TauT family transport system substrate-binding protein
VELGFPNINAALSNQAIDAAIHADPFIAQGAASGLLVRWAGADQIAPNQQVSVLVYSPTFAERDPDAARKFMVGYLLGARDFYNAVTRRIDRAELVDLLNAYLKLPDPSLYARMTWPGLDPNGRVNRASLQEMQEWYVQLGAQAGLVDLDQVVDEQYVDYALRVLGPYQAP